MTTNNRPSSFLIAGRFAKRAIVWFASQYAALWRRSGKNGRIAMACCSVFVLLFALSGVGSLCGMTGHTRSASYAGVATLTAIPTATLLAATEGTGAPTSALALTDTPTATGPAGPTSTPLPTYTPKPTLSSQEILQSDIISALGKANRNVPRLASVKVDQGAITVQWAINDNLFSDMISKSGKEDVVKILQAIVNSGQPYEMVHVVGTFSMKDAYGNVSEEPVVHATYSKTTIEKINWTGFDPDNVYQIADSATVHPQFQ